MASHHRQTNFQLYSPSTARMKYYIQWIKFTALHPSTHIRTTSHIRVHKPAGSYRGDDKSLARSGRKQDRKHARDGRDLNKIETRAMHQVSFPARLGAQGNARDSDTNISLFPSWSSYGFISTHVHLAVDTINKINIACKAGTVYSGHRLQLCS